MISFYNSIIYKTAFLLSIFISLSIYSDDVSIINTVDHKNFQLDVYLDMIRYNLQEKLGIIPYILQNKEGIYLEVGTGGDPVAALLSSIPNDISPTIIASDIDQNILDALPLRHPRLQTYLASSAEGPQLKLQQLDATDMRCFADNYLSGINASALVHEIVSYAGGIKGLDNFFNEAFRVLKPSGILIYRDAEAVMNKAEIVKVLFKDASIKMFTHIFLNKFLDCRYGLLAQSGTKYIGYDNHDLTFIFYKKNELHVYECNYEDYLRVRSCEIDFNRPYSIHLPRGLCREIERHYLTYLHQCNPLVFVKCLPNVDSNSYILTYLSHSKMGIIEQFLANNVMEIENNMIAISSKQLIDEAIIKNSKVIEYGIHLCFTSFYKKSLFIDLLKQHGFEPNRYIVFINDSECLLDYRIFSLLYDYLIDKVFDDKNGPVNKVDLVHAEYLKREGEETYIYYSDDELIAHVGEISLSQSCNDNEECYILCPLSADHNRFAPRLSYDEVLKTSLDINDIYGYPCEIKEGKQIIHFSKMPLAQAIDIYKDIIAMDPMRYREVQKFVNALSVKK